MEPAVELRKNETAHEYELWIGGEQAGHADYQLVGNTVVLPSVVIRPSHRGGRLGSTLVKFALDDVIAAGNQIDPVCPFVKAYIQRHPEYERFVADGR